jgi:hypothetical protein
MEYWCKQSQTFQWKWKMTNTAIKNVPVQIDENVPVSELGHGVLARSYTSEQKIKDIAIEKYRSGGNGITFQDVIERFSVKKSQAQRSLKHFHARGILFTAEDLISQGIDLVENKSPQQYFPTCIKADIIENLKKRKNVLVDPTEVTSSNAPLSNVLAQQKSQNILDLLTNLPFAPLCIHKLVNYSYPLVQQPMTTLNYFLTRTRVIALYTQKELVKQFIYLMLRILFIQKARSWCILHVVTNHSSLKLIMMQVLCLLFLDG